MGSSLKCEQGPKRNRLAYVIASKFDGSWNLFRAINLIKYLLSPNRQLAADARKYNHFYIYRCIDLVWC